MRGGTGAEVIYALRNSSTLADKVLANIEQTGQNVRRIYQRRLPSDNSKDYYFIHRNTGKTEPIIVEYGFIDNTNDVNFLNNNYQPLADAVIEAVLNYKGIKYEEPPTIDKDTYTVQKGDSLYAIANKYNTTIDELKVLNNLTTNQLQIGQKIKIPSTKVPVTDSNLYTVKPNDTLYSIAKNNKVTVDELKEINNLSSNNLEIGQILIIPSGIITDNTYQVKSGDSLYSIAKKYNTTVDNIKKTNNLDSNIISVGQILVIPETNENEYIVKSGDTIFSIAKKYNLTTEELKRINNLTSNLLSVGQKLIVPTSSDSKIYTVIKGDTLYAISRKFDISVDKLKQLNNLVNDNLVPGQILIIE